MTLFSPQCRAPDCDFKLVLGDGGHALVDWVGYCRGCFRPVALRELTKSDPAYTPDLAVFRVLTRNPDFVPPPKRPKPSARRVIRRARKTGADGAVNQAAAQPEYLETAWLLYFDGLALAADREQGCCPNCGRHGSVRLKIDVATTPCPKCGDGVLEDATALMDVHILRPRR